MFGSTWSALVYQKPNAPVSPYAHVFKDVPMELFGDPPRPRRDSSTDGDSMKPGYSLISAFEQAKLYRIVHEILIAYCGIGGVVSVESIMPVYERLLSWKRELPMAISHTDSEAEAPPHLLFLQ